MILRRVIAHFRKQEWTAIFLDFLIVVIGVFVGIQVSNWNAARIDRAHERALLANVRDDIRQDIAESRRRIGLLEQAAAFGKETLSALSGDPCADDCWRVIVGAFHASQWFDLATPRPTFEEMQRLGLPRDKTLKDRLNTYYILSDGILATNDLPRYRELVRSLIPPEAQERLWEGCYHLDGRKEILTADCAPALGPEQGRAVVDGLRSHEEIARTLTYRLSAIAVLIKVLNSRIDEGKAVISLLDAEIGAAE